MREFDQLLDPRASSAPDQDRSPVMRESREQALGRGIPEVSRPRGRLALPAMVAGAVLVTGAFVYSVSSAGQAELPTGLTAGSPPEAPRPPVLGEDAARGAPSAEAPSVAAPRTKRGADSGRQDLREARLERQHRAEERLRSPLLVSSVTHLPSGDVAVRPPASDNGDANIAFLTAASDRETPTSRARVLRHQDALIAQGTLIAGVLETALNSDLPGMLRAVVAADVASFDGRHVLIPRGSRLIGEYRSGIAIGQSRAFVVWTRLITPGGVSISLGSPGTDALGQAGLTGRVDQHFFERFGAALLLSVVGSAGQAAANAAGNGESLTINAASDASRVAELALQNQVNIPPTIKVRQGTPIRIFVARDLDFAGTESAALSGERAG